MGSKCGLKKLGSRFTDWIAILKMDYVVKWHKGVGIELGCHLGTNCLPWGQDLQLEIGEHALSKR